MKKPTRQRRGKKSRKKNRTGGRKQQRMGSQRLGEEQKKSWGVEAHPTGGASQQATSRGGRRRILDVPNPAFNPQTQGITFGWEKKNQRPTVHHFLASLEDYARSLAIQEERPSGCGHGVEGHIHRLGSDVWFTEEPVFALKEPPHDDERFGVTLAQSRAFLAEHQAAEIFDVESAIWTKLVAESVEIVTRSGNDLDPLLAAWPKTTFPFHVCYFGCGEGFFDPDFSERMRAMGCPSETPGFAKFTGLLVSQSGNVHEIYQYYEPRSSGAPGTGGPIYLWVQITNALPGNRTRVVGGPSIAPILALRLISFINSYQHLVLENYPGRLWVRQELKRWKKDKGLRGTPPRIPQRYYEIQLRDTVTQRGGSAGASTESTPRGPLMHRVKVMTHSRIYVRRGGYGGFPIKLDEETKAVLLDRGYTIHRDSFAQVEPALLKKLQRRQHAPLSEGEWMATMERTIEEHYKGPEDAPYVPAVRVATPRRVLSLDA